MEAMGRMKRGEAGPMLHEGSTRRDRWWLPTWRSVAVLLLLGLIVNLGVAVAIARWGVEPAGQGFIYTTPESGRPLNASYWLRLNLRPTDSWPGPIPNSWPPSPWAPIRGWHPQHLDGVVSQVAVERALNWTPGWSIEAIDVSTSSEAWEYEVHRIGFPLGSLRFDKRFDHQYAPSSSKREDYDHLVGGISFLIPPAWPFGEFWTLPLIPVATGLIVNSIAYAALVWLAKTQLQLLRRRRRLRRGECMNCRYPLVPGWEVCPECGTVAPPSDQRVANCAPVAPAQYAVTSPNSEHAP